jgi:hypothetical protein
MNLNSMALGRLALAVLASISAVSVVSAEPKPSPLDAQAQVAPLAHRSALQQFRRAGSEAPKPTPWREANDTVERIGGWRSYLREANTPDIAASAPASQVAPASSSTPPPKATHKHH